MPRGRDECWQEVTRALDEESGKRHPRVTCKHCLTHWTSNEKARVIDHLQRCTELPEILWRTYQPHRLDPTLPSAAELQQQQRARTRGIGSMSSTEQDIATAACAQWINAANLSPSITEHPAFRSFLRTLRPAFKPPTRHQLTHALVDAPLMLVAYLADPTGRHSRPAILDSNEETQSRSLQSFLLKYCSGNAHRAANLLGLLSLLRVKQGPFMNNMIWLAAEQMSPIQWWQNFWIEEQPDLAELCIIALAIAPTNQQIQQGQQQGNVAAAEGGSVERNWSPHSFVHALKRNQLSPEVINRLVATFWGLRIKHGWVEDSSSSSQTMMGGVGGGGGGGGGMVDGGGEQDAEFSPEMDGVTSFMGMQA